VPNRYRPPSTPPKGAWGRHIDARRREWGWSQTEGFRRCRAGLRLSENSRSAYLKLDHGDAEPDEAQAKALAKVYGWPPALDPERPAEEEPAPLADAVADQAALIAALGKQTDAINALVRELQLGRERDQDAAAAILRAAEALGSIPRQSEDGASTGQPALPGSPR